MNNLAYSYDQAGRRDEALKLREEVLALCHQGARAGTPRHAADDAEPGDFLRRGRSPR